jgi:predicted porin
MWHSPFKALGYGHQNNFGSVLLDVFGEANNATVKGILGNPGFVGSCSGTGDSAGNSSFAVCGELASFDLRFANTIAYWSPVINDNLSFQFHYSTNEGKSDDLNPSLWAANVIFDNGTWGLGAAYEQHNDLAGLSNASLAGSETGSKDTAWRLTGGWKGGGFAVNLTWENLDYSLDGVDEGLQAYDRNAWALGASYSWDNISIRARYSKADDGDCTDASGDACSTSGAGAHAWALGYTYKLSGRTQLIANYVRLDNGANANYNLGYGNDAGVGGTGQDAKSFTIGLQHGF